MAGDGVSVTGAMRDAFRSQFEQVFLGDVCREHRAEENWDEWETFPCHVETGQAGTGVPIDFEGGNGYGYIVHVPADKELRSSDYIDWRHATNAAGVLQIQRVAPVETLAPTRRAEAVMR